MTIARTRRLALAPMLLLALAGGGGCARYEYDVVRPPELARHVGSQDWVTAARDPIEYQFRTVENHLVVQAFNRSSETVQFLGDKSLVVDPKGQSHPMKSQPIAPGSFMRVVLPPMPARVDRSGPSFGIGVGVGIGGAYGGRHGYHAAGGPWDDPFVYDEPRYYAVYDPNDATYWEWDGEGEVRVVLAYDRGGQAVSHEFVFRRKRV